MIQFAQNAQNNLESKPTQTLEFVETLTFLDTIQEEIDERERVSEIARQLYSLIDEYQVPTPPEDLAVYQVARFFVLYFSFILDLFSYLFIYLQCHPDRGIIKLSSSIGD